MNNNVIAARASAEMLEYLLKRRSVKKLGAPGPSAEQIDTILRAASRVPDRRSARCWPRRGKQASRTRHPQSFNLNRNGLCARRS
jgi:hypothetical protein